MPARLAVRSSPDRVLIHDRTGGPRVVSVLITVFYAGLAWMLWKIHVLQKLDAFGMAGLVLMAAVPLLFALAWGISPRALELDRSWGVVKVRSSWLGVGVGQGVELALDRCRSVGLVRLDVFAPDPIPTPARVGLELLGAALHLLGPLGMLLGTLVTPARPGAPIYGIAFDTVDGAPWIPLRDIDARDGEHAVAALRSAMETRTR